MSSSVSRSVSEHPPYGLKDALVSSTPSVRTPHRIFAFSLSSGQHVAGRFGSERIQLINPVFCLFFCQVGVSFLCILLLWRAQTKPTAWGAVCPSHRIFFTNYAFKAEVVV